MKQCSTAEKLIESIDKAYKKFIEEFKIILEELRDKHSSDVDKRLLKYYLIHWGG